MRVGVVCPYDLSKPGGVQAQVFGLATALEDLGDEVTIIGPGLPPDIGGIDLGRTLPVPGNGSVAPLSVRTTYSIRRQIADVDVDLLHVHEPLMPSVSLGALRAGRPVVATFHAAPGAIGTRFYDVIASRLTRILGPNVKRVTAVSRSAAAPISILDPEIIANGVDVGGMSAQSDRDRNQVVFLGRDEPRKGLDVLLDAWPAVSAAHPSARLVVMGATRSTPGVEWLGRVDDQTKIRVLNAAGLYIAPNTGGESFGIVLVEAMAAGTAVVASDLDAFSDVGGDAVEYFKTGSSADLARVIIELLGSPEEMDRMARSGSSRAARYHWPIIASQYREVYSKALS